ncbi:Rho GTPase-activating protein 30 Rho-type GTPase-activating protein 30 [Larimichthys crocea]|uniref:Rho GTPase-activating protein 30 Rho-type GTPase-activating protein 30 n=1 Tax=Larimichthys crocea TaxID=215358 RepID=A0A6G0IGZ8_LARCR|nr:Rho GTPase-activating protein 30 Rho-type GTPase-activating protein 30 [Larimichthys crocea]
MRRVRRKGANKEKVFGCDLLEHLNASSQEIPLVLRSCSEFVETHGIVDGIYRLSGVSSNIQKLRGEFESDGSPELNKDLYLQDIHCVSSLCKAYFRELPNPLLTYQLYDKFAEAVAIQLEEERLVKIRDVLKELPRPHYRTLEFLMRHLVRMASYSSETNMHARNLAIVWAPNLLRSKDIEASGFNGTAAFMEVRVQSIVVEFILTHVPQLFPEAGDSNERRKSLPSPTAACVPEEFFRSQPVPNFGNISPGDGPLAIRPYHAIIEGTDKRKGSLKGRKWMSIFNIGGRFPDPRRRHKHSAKEKERQVLRPARSMDSLSTPPYPNEGCRRPAQRPPSNNIPTPSPLITSSPKPGLDVTVSTGALGGSEYAVTYRRGTGLVSGGTQGTYTALDPEGLGLTGNETLQSRSPGISTKVGRRAAMHITGPTMVTVPLHITSNLALGVLQGGGGDRIIHRGRDKDGGDRVEGKEGGEKVERRESRVIEKKVEESRQVEEEEEINHREKVLDAEETTVPDDGGEEGGEEKKEDEEELVTGGRGVSREERIRSFSASNTDEDNEEDAVISDYMDMKGMQPVDFQPEVTDHDDDGVYDSFNVLSSTEVEGDDLGLSGYVQDNFDFLDQMDCSAMDHMDCSVPCQVNEFSVEPPGHSDDEYEVMEQAQTSCQPAEVQTHVQPDPETRTRSQTELNPHRPLSLDINSRHTKSLSLPYMTSPVRGPEDSSSEDEVEGDDSDENYYSSDDDNDSMFVKSLPPDFFLSNLPDFKPDTDEQDCCTHDGVPACQFQSCEERECQPQNHECAACEESHEGDEEQIEVRDKVDEDQGREEKEITKTEEEDNVYQEGEQLENNKQSKPTEEDCSVMEDTQSDKEQRISSEASTHCCAEFPPLSDDESSTMTYTTVEEEKEVVDNPYRDYLPCQAVSSVTQRESADVLLEESRDFSAAATEQPGICVREDAMEKDSDEGDGWRVCKEIDDMCHEMGQEMKEDDWEVCEEAAEEEIKPEETMQGVGKEQDGAICGTSNDIGDELEDEEEAQVEKKAARESVREGDGMEDVKVAEEEEEEEEEEEQLEKVSEEMVEDGEEGTKEAEVRIEVVEDSVETSEEKLTDTEMQREFEEKETNLPNTSEQDEAIQRQHAMNDKTQQLHREEVVSKEKENNDERAGEHNTKPSVDKQVKEVRSDKKEEGRKYEENDSSQGGVGRKLVVSKNPKVYQVKAVPVVPPKPQHCKITALTLRQQQQQRERRDAGSVGTTLRVPAEQDRVSAGGEQGKDGDRDGERERRREGDEGAASRNSPLSMCFDEAVAIATMRREKEKGCEKEKERQRDRGNEVQ